MAFSPSLLELLTDPEFIPAKWQPLVEIQFNAPKLSVGSNVPQLSFGTILNAAIIFTKALTIVSISLSSSFLIKEFLIKLFFSDRTATIQIR